MGIFKKNNVEKFDEIQVNPNTVTIHLENVNKVETQNLDLSQNDSLLNDNDIKKFNPDY